MVTSARALSDCPCNDTNGVGVVCLPGDDASLMYCLSDCAAHCLLDLAHLTPLGLSVMFFANVLCHDCKACAFHNADTDVLCQVKCLFVAS